MSIISYQAITLILSLIVLVFFAIGMKQDAQKNIKEMKAKFDKFKHHSHHI